MYLVWLVGLRPSGEQLIVGRAFYRMAILMMSAGDDGGNGGNHDDDDYDVEGQAGDSDDGDDGVDGVAVPAVDQEQGALVFM